tara:strand:- start:11631 stop:11876 length:246 start_codon:yes stop_codon:yes gene_type:complete
MSATKEAEMLIQPKDKIELTEEQAQIWRQVFAERKQIQEHAQALDQKIHTMMAAAGWAGQNIVEGDLGEEPYFVLERVPDE